MGSTWTGAPLIVVPDTHGHLGHVEALVRRCTSEGYLADHRLAFLGDYLDRGPAARALLEYCIALRRDGHIFLAGNHEEALLRALYPLPFRSAWIARWMQKYEDGVLTSYGLRRPTSSMPAAWRWAADALREAMPQSHRRFLATLPFFHETASLILIHAGILPTVPWEMQRIELETRPRHDPRGPAQLFSHALARTIAHQDPRVVVSGHVTWHRPLQIRNRHFLHCGVELGGPLVAWVSDRNRYIVINT